MMSSYMEELCTLNCLELTVKKMVHAQSVHIQNRKIYLDNLKIIL